MNTEASVRPKAIVVGDRLQTAVVLKEDDIRKACKKRYDGQVDEDLMDDALKASSLKEAVDILVQDTIKHGGDPKRLILTQEELNHRNALMNFEGIFKVLFSEMNKTVCSPRKWLNREAFEKIVHQQFGIRRIPQWKSNSATGVFFKLFMELGSFVEINRKFGAPTISFKEEKVYHKETTEAKFEPSFQQYFLKD